MLILRHTLHFLFLVMLTSTLAFSGDSANSQQIDHQVEVITPTETIELFNGENLDGFYTWLEGGLEFDDPNNVFTVVDRIDGAPAIRVSGENWGGFITEKAYANYHLIVEFRWGEVTWGSRKDRTMDSGILLHAQEPVGSSRADFSGPWMRSVEYQMIEGGTGDFILVGGHTEDGERLTTRMKARVSQDYNGQYVWDPEGEIREFEGGRINWYGRDPDWEDVLGFRGMQDVEKPVGEWNRIEVIVDEGTFVYLLNGTIVNKGFDSELTEGKLLFQSEGAETFFRRIELRPLP